MSAAIPGAEPATAEVADFASLSASVASTASTILVHGTIECRSTIQLRPGQHLSGATADAALQFDGDGVCVASDTTVSALRIETPSDARALYVERSETVFGRLGLSDLTIRGRVSLIFDTLTAPLHMHVARVHVAAADTRADRERPVGNGVEVLQGAFTLWNKSPSGDPVRLAIAGLSVGSADSPVSGSGVFLCGGDSRIVAETIEIGAVHADSGLPAGTTGTVAGGLFVLKGTSVEHVRSVGSLVTHGANAVPVDNWGTIKRWTVDGDVITHGPSAIAIVNAGTLDLLVINGRVETSGEGARGCSIYGPTGCIRLHRVETRGDAAVGVQIVDRLEWLDVKDAIVTHGKTGAGLIKGVMHNMPADGVHIELGAVLSRLTAPTIVIADSQALPVRNEGTLASVDPI